MSALFNRNFISAQHGRRSPVPAEFRFLFDEVEADARARLDFLKEKPQTVALHGRRFFNNAETEFPAHARFKLSDDEQLQFFGKSHGAYDLILSLFSLHAVNDVPGVLKQFKDTLTEKGMVLACVFGPQTLATLRQALAAAEAEIFGAAGPRLYPFAGPASWVGQMQNAGYALPVADSEILTVHYKTLNGLLKDIRMMGEASGLIHRTRRPLFPKIIARAEEIYKEIAPDPDGLLQADYEIIWLQGFRS